MSPPEHVVVTVDEMHVDRIQQVADALRQAGFEVNQVLGTSGIITGNVEPSKRASLASVPGVMAVEDDQTIQLAPPDSKIQ
jgi:methylmalonyl-CoA mutase cobalamin-binding subunit